MVFAEASGQSNLYEMVKYCEEVRKCRRVLIAEHFGETFDEKKCGKKCDNCKDSIKCTPKDVTQEVKKLIKIMKT